MNIQIGGNPHKDGEIDNPEFYYQAMDIIDKFHVDHEKAMLENRMKEEPIKRESKVDTCKGVWIYVVVGIVWLVLMSRLG